MILSKWYILPYEILEDPFGNVIRSPKYTDNASVVKFSSIGLNEPVNCLTCVVSDIEYHNQLSNIDDAYILGDKELAELFNSKFDTDFSMYQVLEILQPLTMNAGE